MSLENEIGQLTKAINELNANFERFFSQTTAPVVAPLAPELAPELAPVEPVEPVVPNDEPTYTHAELQNLCLEATKRNPANRDVARAIMLTNFNVRKASELKGQQITDCYNLIKEATK